MLILGLAVRVLPGCAFQGVTCLDLRVSGSGVVSQPSYENSTFSSCVILLGGFMLLGPRRW